MSLVSVPLRWLFQTFLILLRMGKMGTSAVSRGLSYTTSKGTNAKHVSICYLWVSSFWLSSSFTFAYSYWTEPGGSIGEETWKFTRGRGIREGLMGCVEKGGKGATLSGIEHYALVSLSQPTSVWLNMVTNLQYLWFLAGFYLSGQYTLNIQGIVE